MSLELDTRQRAMLREMGVTVWLPGAQAVAAPTSARPERTLATAGSAEKAALSLATVSATVHDAIDLVAKNKGDTRANGSFHREAAMPAVFDADRGGHGQALWTVEQPFSPYPESVTGAGARWLVLAEMPAASPQAGTARPFEGDAGKLLDNMLRAARLHEAAVLWLSPLVRQAGAPSAPEDLSAALAALFAVARPDVVLVMGRLAAQALLASTEPFARLRGRTHQLHGIKIIVTHDAGYLLRTPADKARAWEDLCLALAVAASPSA